jgi:hypothetical protein
MMFSMGPSRLTPGSRSCASRCYKSMALGTVLIIEI